MGNNGDDDEVINTQQMEAPEGQQSYGSHMPLPPKVRLTLEIIGGPDRGTTITLTSGRAIIGRSDADLVLDEPNVSKKHAVIEAFSRTNIYIRDLASTNGTIVNGAQIAQKKLSDGDVIQIGNVIMRFRRREIAQ